MLPVDRKKRHFFAEAKKLPLFTSTEVGVMCKRSNVMKQILIAGLLLVATSSYAWDGYDYDKGSYVEIEKGNLVRHGEEIEYYDYDSGEYKYGYVESIESYGSSVEVEIYDSDTGEYRTFEMDR